MNLITIDVPDKPLAIAAIGDIQFTGLDKMQMGCSVDHLKEHLNWLDKGSHLKGHTVRYIGTGDYVDLMSPSNRERYRVSGYYSTAARTIEGAYAGIVEKLAKILAPHMKGKTVTLCKGHHWFQFQNWRKLGLPCEDTDRYLGYLLGLKEEKDWGITEALVAVTFKWPNGARYRVMATHGEGNGQTLTYAINKLVRQAYGWEGIHAMFMGHTHRLTGGKAGKLEITDTAVVERDFWVASCGSFLKGFIKDDELYPEKGQMGPLAIGGAALSVYPKKKKEGRWLFESVLLER
jgi:hypothetical protein